MSQQWCSTFERWTSSDYKKLHKVKNVVLQFTRRKRTNDVPIVMSQLPRESMTTLYKLNNSKNLRNSLNISGASTENANEMENTVSEDKRVHDTQVSINLDSISNSNVDTIEIDGFKFKILKYVENEDGENSETIKVKIMLPKGTSYTFDDETNDEEVQDHRKGDAFKPEDFSTLNEKFVAFANSLIDVGSLDFAPTDLACSSPLPKVEELIPILEMEERNIDDVQNKALNNSLDLLNDKDMKLLEFIDNISATTLELSPSGRNCFSPMVAGNLKNNSTKRRIKYYDDINKQNFYNRNITGPEFHADSIHNLCNAKHHNVDTCDYKYPKPLQFVTKDSTPKLAQRETCSEVPIMGRNVLLAKLNVSKQQKDESNKKTDPEIIEEIVKDRFRNFLTDHCRRSMKRKSRTQISVSSEDNNKESHSEIAFNCDQNQATGEVVLEANENGDEVAIVKNPENHNLTPEVHVICAGESSNDEVDQEEPASYKRTASVSDGGFVSESSSSKLHKPLDIQIDSLTSSATSLVSRDFGEFIESGLFDSEYHFVGGVGCRDSQTFRKTELDDDVDLSTTCYEDPFAEPYKIYRAHCEPTLSMDHSIGTSELSALISGRSVGTLPEMRPKNLAKTMEDTIDEELDLNSLTYDYDANTTEQLLANLTTEATIQFQIIQQTLKALDLCKSVKEFVSSPEQIEAEKILLTATCQREAVVQEINRLQLGEIHEEMNYRGFVQLSNFRFPSKPIDRTSDSAKKNKDFTQWFVCIINCGTKVFATDAGMADFEGNVCFNTQVSFANLKPDFEITVTIYAMKVKNNQRSYSHESKYHLNKHSETTCPSPTKLLTFKRRSTSRLPEPSLKPSSFTLWGNGSIKIGDLGKRTSFQMRNVPKCSTLCDQFLVAIQSSVDIKEHFSGFLHVGTQSNSSFVTWNRRWCTLNDTELRLWNDPTECGNPIEIVDLRSCINSWISVVERSICARSKTLLLETKDDTRQVIRYLLSADTTRDMKKWEEILNSVVSSLRSWHCMKYRSSSELDETSL